MNAHSGMPQAHNVGEVLDLKSALGDAKRMEVYVFLVGDACDVGVRLWNAEEKERRVDLGRMPQTDWHLLELSLQRFGQERKIRIDAFFKQSTFTPKLKGT